MFDQSLITRVVISRIAQGEKIPLEMLWEPIAWKMVIHRTDGSQETTYHDSVPESPVANSQMHVYTGHNRRQDSYTWTLRTQYAIYQPAQETHDYAPLP